MSCEPSQFEGRKAPVISQKLPAKATSAYATWLEVKVIHGAGETVLPAGLSLAHGSEEAKELGKSQFALPDPASPTQPELTRTPIGDQFQTVIRIPLIPLPKSAGRVELTVPTLPIRLGRSSGAIDTLCTNPQTLLVEDPLASGNDQSLEKDPGPRSQLAVWTEARDAAIALAVALPVLALATLLIRKFLPRLRPGPPPRPPEPPWQVALAALSALERERLLESARYDVFYDRVADTLRAYLGDRYGAGGLEATTRETLRLLPIKAPHFAFEREVKSLLQRADLVKFAQRIPEETECRQAIEQVRFIIQKTTPAPSLDPRGPTSPSPSGDRPGDRPKGASS